MLVRSPFLFAFFSLAAYASAQEDDSDDYNDDCYDPDESSTASSTFVTSISEASSSTSNSGSCPILPSPSTTDTITYLTAIATESTVNPVTTTVYISTYTSTAPQPTDQTDVSYATQTFAATTETSYTGRIFTSVVFSIVPAETTITVPRAADFTPLKCESAYVGPFVTTTYSYTGTVNTYSIVATETVNSTTTEVVYPSTLIFPSTTIDTTVTTTLQSTTVVTSIRNDPTSTVYAACQGTDNVTPDAPPSKYKYVGQAVPVIGTYSSVVAAIDQVDCCALCQANEQCTASTYYTKPILGESLDTPLVHTACQLFLKNDTSSTCDTSFIGATMQFDYPNIINYFSNGPCGQYNFTYDEPRLVDPVGYP